jgi:CBS domain-containing protein
MKIREIMTKDVETAAVNESVEQAAIKMRDEDTGALPIMDADGELAGILTDRDIVVRCIAEGKDPSEVVVGEILSEELETVEPDADVEEASRIMSRKQIRRLPVVEDGEFVGIVSLGDIAVKESKASASEALRGVSRGVKPGAGEKAGLRRTGRSAGARSRELEEIRSGRELTEEAEEREEALQTGSSRSLRSTSTRAGSKIPAQGITNRGSKLEQARQGKVLHMRPDANRGKGRRVS